MTTTDIVQMTLVRPLSMTFTEPIVLAIDLYMGDRTSSPIRSCTAWRPWGRPGMGGSWAFRVCRLRVCSLARSSRMLHTASGIGKSSVISSTGVKLTPIKILLRAQVFEGERRSPSGSETTHVYARRVCLPGRHLS